MLLRTLFFGKAIPSPRPFLLAWATAPVGRQMATPIVLLLALPGVATHFTSYDADCRDDAGDHTTRVWPRVRTLTA